MKQLPNLFTLLNLFFGCIAIIFILQNGISIMYSADGNQLVDMPEKIWMASLFMALAAVVDFLDGFVARLFGATSDKGKQLDSLADVVSFGVAPGLILYQFLRMSFMKQENGLEISMFWLLPALIVPCAAAYRLAKFNIDSAQKYVFKGMPSPAAGLLIASLPLIYWHTDSEIILKLLLNKWFLYAFIVLISYLMVCNLSLMALKFKDLTLKNNLSKIILLLIAVIAGIFFKWLAVPVVFIFYILLSLAFKNETT
ncbi:MAG TPA: CDP-alcohol phosphatidyltransferase family protein [Puia sp.]|jgi:CDP-diacylglycerol--serine O-phosphatidyltransferase|nr:CDP-alcohol phosphatidyltransferase family protein [Puia sp.]